jgi:hypothetical protein
MRRGAILGWVLSILAAGVTNGDEAAKQGPTVERQAPAGC